MTNHARGVLLWRGVILLGTLGLVACDGAERAFEGDYSTNQPPNTEIVGTPPTLSRTDFEVGFQWRGVDHDGDIVGFEWRISDNGEDGMLSVLDTLEAYLPWHFTTATDTVFQVLADLDSFPVDLSDPDRDPRHIRFWQTHTLFVRAIDEQGARDPTPAHSSFTATTLAPTALITVPKVIPTVTCVSASRVLTFGWTATDPDGFRLRPKATRYLLYPVQRLDGSCFTQLTYQLEQPIRPDDSRWSDWIPYDPDLPESHQVTLPRSEVNLAYLFAVQALDDAGATTPVFEWNRNVRHVRTSDFQLPLLRVTEPRLGSYSFVGTTITRSFDVIGGQPLNFSWEADASTYAGTIDAYRYGWDVADPDDSQDPAWAVGWGQSSLHLQSPPKIFEGGAHRLIVRARDNSGTEVQASIVLNVIPVPPRDQQRPLLIVDDFPNGTSDDEKALDATWDSYLRSLVEGSLIGYSGGDFLDADKPDGRLNFRNLIEYRAILWFLGPSNQSYWYRQFATGGNPVRFVEIYQQSVGNLLLVGPGSLYSTTSHGGAMNTYPQVFDRNFNYYPARSQCLEFNDLVRPAPGSIVTEEGGVIVRTLACDGMYRARPHEQFLSEYPDAIGELVDLQPTFERVNLDRSWDLDYEEFYNVNVTTRRLPFLPRSCQTPMFALESRRAAGLISNPAQNCRPRNIAQSTLEGVPVAIATRSYADDKPLRGAEDFVWGFHPAAFRQQDVKAALRYVLSRRWDMPVVR